MKEVISVITVRNDYGKINLHLKEILDRLQIKRGRLAKLTDTRFEVIDKWYNNNVERLDLDILARICYVLDCEPSDLISYDKPESEKESQ